MSTNTVEGFELVGLALPQKTSNENGLAMVDCASLWNQFVKGNYAFNIKHKTGPEVYAVYHNYDGDHTKPYDFFIGVKVSEGSATPPGMDRLVIPSNNYEIVKAKGKVPESIGAAWVGIWKSSIPRKYAPDFEVYGDKSREGENSEVDIYLSVK